jgi:hypothetical protein
MNRRARVAVLVAGTCGAALAGCGGGGAAPPAAAANQAAGAAASDTVAHPAAARPRQGPIRTSLPDSASPPEYRREVFRYAGGPRDPFESLIASRDVGPMISDLRLVSITYDPRTGNSVAVVRAARDPRPIRLHRGDTVGRMRVIQIRQYEVVFQIEEFGFERQETLTLRRPEVSR